MRAVALHPDVLLATSSVWQTNCVVVRGGEESFVVDSPILPDELEALPALIERARFPAPSGLLATHGDWDHLLGRLAFPGLAMGWAHATAERVRAAPGEAQRELRKFDEEFLVERPQPLALGAAQVLPLPGRCGIGELELELYPSEGHTADGMAIWIPWARALVAGDYLSTVEIPALEQSWAALGGEALAATGSQHSASNAQLDAYVATLDRLRPVVEGADHVVPGHGPVLDAERALTVIGEDLAYLRELRELGVGAELPPGRRTRTQRARHVRNAAATKPDC